jgi:hypothetical protein
MPKLTVEGFASVDVEPGKRLVLAIEQDAHVDILHACGGNTLHDAVSVHQRRTAAVGEGDRRWRRGLTGAPPARSNAITT